MLTIEKLKAFGADTDEGLTRCMNDEKFYLMLVGSALKYDQIDTLEKQIASDDLDAAFETAHALKGVYANLSLTPIYRTIFDITELLRSKEEIDYSELLVILRAQMDELSKLTN